LETERPTSDFDKVVEQVKQLGVNVKKIKKSVVSKVKKSPAKKKGKKGRGREK
jgi:hypothetical protein